MLCGPGTLDFNRRDREEDMSKIIDHEEFVRVYMAYSGAIEAVAEALSITKSTVRRRYKKLIDAKVKLPPLEGVQKTLDVKALNQLIAEFEKNNE